MLKEDDYYLLSAEERAEINRAKRILDAQIKTEWERLGKSVNGVEFQRRCLPYANDMAGFLAAIRRGDFGKPKE